jgi:hypothetical protein
MPSEPLTNEVQAILKRPVSDEELAGLIRVQEHRIRTAVYGGGSWQVAIRVAAALNALQRLRKGIPVEGSVG